jgi:hypothetical protein
MKKGVKRKFYTTRETATSIDPLLTPTESTSMQTETGRQMKKRKYLTEHDHLYRKEASPFPSSGLSSQPPASGVKPKKKFNNSLTACNEILKELFFPELSCYAWPVYKLINTDLPKLCGYHDAFKETMDFRTVHQKMHNQEYKTASEFAADVRLIFTNCYQHNPPDQDLVAMARKL